MKIDVREYQEKDLESVNKILEESFNIKKKNFKNDNYKEIVITVDDKVCGYLLLTKIFNPIIEKYYIHVDYVCISSKYRNMGLGKILMDYVDLLVKNMNIIYIELTSGRQRVAAHKLYEKCGYIKRDSDIYRKEII